MKLTMHVPDTEEGKKELARRVARLHAQAVIDHISSLTCSCEEKSRLIGQIMDERRKSSKGG